MLYTLWSDRLPNVGDRMNQLFVMIITYSLDSQIFPNMNNTTHTYTVHQIDITLNDTTITQTVNHKLWPLWPIKYGPNKQPFGHKLSPETVPRRAGPWPKVIWEESVRQFSWPFSVNFCLGVFLSYPPFLMCTTCCSSLFRNTSSVPQMHSSKTLLLTPLLRSLEELLDHVTCQKIEIDLPLILCLTIWVTV